VSATPLIPIARVPIYSCVQVSRVLPKRGGAELGRARRLCGSARMWREHRAQVLATSVVEEFSLPRRIARQFSRSVIEAVANYASLIVT
jgi:hypothetical protein